MKTRIVKVSEGYVPQVLMANTSRRFFTHKQTEYWYGIDYYGQTVKDPMSQILSCVVKEEQEANNRINRYLELEKRKKKEEEDITLLTSYYDPLPPKE